MCENISAPALNRIPGTMQIKEKHSKDLKTLSYNELLEMKERQSKVLTFKKRLQQLPDKGKRMQDSYDKLLAEIQRRNDVDAAAAMFSQLNIVSKGKTVLSNLEWNGRLIDDSPTHMDDILDSDDELELDPLRVIAQRTMHERQLKVLPPAPTLITAADLVDIASFDKTAQPPDSALAEHSDISGASSSNSTRSTPQPLAAADLIVIDAAKLGKCQQSAEMDQHALYLIEKTELQVLPARREKFKPFRTTISNVHDPAKERVRKKGKHWEVTAATPPLIQHEQVQLLPLAESASLQMEYMQKVQALRAQQAEARLAKQQQQIQPIRLPEQSILKTKSSFQNYRSAHTDYLIEGKQHASELGTEVHDPAAVERQVNSGVNYIVYE